MVRGAGGGGRAGARSRRLRQAGGQANGAGEVCGACLGESGGVWKMKKADVQGPRVRGGKTDIISSS